LQGSDKLSNIVGVLSGSEIERFVELGYVRPPFRLAANSPRLLSAVAQLLEGEAWHQRPNLGNLVVRLPSDEDPGDTGWHIDGSFQGPTTDDLSTWYVDYRSTGRALLLLCLLSDVGSDDAPTRFVEGSHRDVPKLLQPLGDAGTVARDLPLPQFRASKPTMACHPLRASYNAPLPARSDARRASTAALAAQASRVAE
jgi:hypothetical protein